MTTSAKRTHSSDMHWAAWLNILLTVFGLWLLVEIITLPPANFNGEIRLPVSQRNLSTPAQYPPKTFVDETEIASQKVSTPEGQVETQKISDSNLKNKTVSKKFKKKTRTPELKDKTAIRIAIPQTGNLRPNDNDDASPKKSRIVAPNLKTTAPPPSTISKRVRIAISDKIARLQSSTDTSTKYVSVWTVNIRREPNNFSDVLFKLRWGQKVTVLEDKGHWEKIETEDGWRGWGHKVLLEDKPPSLDRISGLKGVVETIRVQMDGARACTIFIDLDVDQPPQTQVFQGEAPRLVSSFNLMMADPKIAPTISIKNGVINAIRVGIADETNLTTRVEVDLIPGVDYVVDQVFYQEEQTYALHIKAKEV